MRLSFILSLILVNTPMFCQPKSFSFIFLNKKTDAVQLSKEESDKIMEGHMANINRLAKEGKLISAGPFEGGGGLFIFNTTSVEEARTWLATDPGVKANRWNIEVLSYTPHIGSACLVKEPYEMVMYQFIRYKSAIGADGKKFVTDFITNLKATADVITEGSFGDTGEGILVLKNKQENKSLEADPAVKEGRLSLDIKQLYIAKGAFCEP